MSSLLSLVLPAALGAFFIFKAVKQPIFLFGIAFMQVMSVSVFFRDLRPFRIPVALGINGVIVMWMVLAWAWCVVRYRSEQRSDEPHWGRGRTCILPEEYPLIGLAALVLVKVAWGGIVSVDSSALLGQSAPWGLLLAGYCLLRGAVRRADSDHVAALVRAVAVATTIASVLFILDQGLGLPIYTFDPYQTLTFQGTTLTRDYSSMSPFLLMALAVGAALVTQGAKGPWKPGSIVMILVCLTAVMVSYTRNYILAAAAVVLALVMLAWLKERRLHALVGHSLTVVAVIGIAVVVMTAAMPGPTAYLLHRMASLTEASTITSDQNVLVRQSYLRIVGTVVNDDYWFAGAPFGPEDAMAQRVSDWTPDSTWVGVLYWTGFAGAALVAATFVLFAVRAVRLFLNTTGSVQFLGAVLFASIVAMSINSLSSWTFLDRTTYAMGFWLFALIAGETLRSTAPGPNITRETDGQDLRGSGLVQDPAARPGLLDGYGTREQP